MGNSIVRALILVIIFLGISQTSYAQNNCDCANDPVARRLNDYATETRPTNADADKNMEMCLQCAYLSVYLCQCRCGTYPGTPEQQDKVIRECIRLIMVWKENHGKNFPPNCKALCEGYYGGCKSANSDNNQSGSGSSVNGNNYGTNNTGQQPLTKSQQADYVNQYTMTEFDGSSEGALKTLAKGTGAMIATGQINAGVVAGAAGLLLSGPSPEEKARRAAAEAAERERIEQERAARLEAERRQNLRSQYEANLKKHDCVNVVSGSGVDEIYTYYIVKTPQAIIFTDVFSIRKQDDGDWPYCTDIEKKLKAQLAKTNKDAVNYQFYVQKPYKSRLEAWNKAESDQLNAEAHYWDKTIMPFKPYGEAPEKDGYKRKTNTDNNFWNE